jgi:hypothetical protein
MPSSQQQMVASCRSIKLPVEALHRQAAELVNRHAYIAEVKRPTWPPTGLPTVEVGELESATGHNKGSVSKVKVDNEDDDLRKQQGFFDSNITLALCCSYAISLRVPVTT